MGTSTKTTVREEVTTAKGAVVRVGQLYRDRRDDNIRTLRVDELGDDGGGAEAQCTVIRQVYRGEITRPMRVTAMTAERLASRSFVLVVDDREHIAEILAEHTAETLTSTDNENGLLVDCSCGAEIYGELADAPETQVGAVQALMAGHIAEMIADTIGQGSDR